MAPESHSNYPHKNISRQCYTVTKCLFPFTPDRVIRFRRALLTNGFATTIGSASNGFACTRQKKRRIHAMMALIFGTLLASLLLAWSGLGRLATVAILACFLLSIGEFLWEIHSPEHGFRMPWI